MYSDYTILFLCVVIILYCIVHTVYTEHIVLYTRSTAGSAQHYLHWSCKIVLRWKTYNDTIYHPILVDSFSIVNKFSLPFYTFLYIMFLTQDFWNTVFSFLTTNDPTDHFLVIVLF